MVRPPDTARRAELLDQTLDYAARHGVAQLSLRPLAAALGTSSRMLVHYFGTKENLIGQVLASSRPDLPGALAGRATEGHPPATIAAELWQDLSSGGPQEPRVRLLLEVMALALTQPERYGSFARAAITAWVDPLTAAFIRTGADPADAADRATMLVSGLRGIALDLFLTRDRQRCDRAASRLIQAATT